MTSYVRGIPSILLLTGLGCLGTAPALAQRPAVTPRAGARLEAPARPTLAFSRAPQGIVPVSAWKPGVRLPIETSGGTPPVTYSITTDHPDHLELIQPPTAANPGIESRGGTGMKELPFTPPRVLHFKGLADRIGSGRSISVELTARDARGAQIKRSFKLLALPARTARLQTDANVVRSQWTRVHATLDLLPPGARVEALETVTYNSSGDPAGIDHYGCWFAAKLGDIPPSVVAGADGKATFTFDGRYIAPDVYKTGPCGLTLRLNVKPPGETQFQKVWSVVTTPLVRLATPTTYRVDRTWALNSKFSYAIYPPLPGSCIGASVFTGGTFPIGAFEDGNGDLALAVRSGPLGTDCSVQSRPWRLPDGFTLTGIDWDVQRTGDKCCLGDDCRPDGAPASKGFIMPGAIPSEAAGHYESGSRKNPLTDATGISAGSNPEERFFHIFNTTQARLACKATASNDHGVKVTLKSLTFEGPAGRTFP